MNNEEILDSLSSLIDSAERCREVYDTFKLAESKIRSKEIVVKAEPRMVRMLSGSAFGRDNDSGEIFIYFGQKFLDTYSRDSSIHHTILIHEMKHMSDYYSVGNAFFESTEKEKYFYEFRAREIEAKFVKHYLKDRLELSRLEEMLLKSYQDDELNNFISMFQRVDKNVYYIFRELEEDYRKGKLTVEGILESLVNGARQLMEGFAMSHTDSSKFYRYVSIKSFRNCLEDIVLYDLSRQHDFNYLLEKDNGRLNEIYSKLYYIIDSYKPQFERYSASLDKLLEDQYI